MSETTSAPFTLRWGIMGTGGIAKTFTKDLFVPTSTRSASEIQHRVVAAASSSSEDRVRAFLQSLERPSSNGPIKEYCTYVDLVGDPDVDIIYVATPHSHHYQHARLALEAGKHVLIEKPVTVNAKQAEILMGIAKEKGCFLMEAVWTRFFPLAREIRQRVQRGDLGRIIRVWADLSFWNDVEKEFGTEHRMVNLDLAGGALLDLGVYSLTWVFQILYHGEPEERRKSPKVGSAMTKYEGTGCDETTSVVLQFEGGGQGIATTSIRAANTPNPDSPALPNVRIQGTKGDIHIRGPCYRPLSYSLIPAASSNRTSVADFEAKEVKHDIPGGGHGMFWEADECARCIRDKKLESEGMPWEETLEVMRVMDEIRKQGGLEYGDLEGIEYSKPKGGR